MSQENPPTKLFTLEEAQRLIPEIEPIVAEIKSAYGKIRLEIAATLETSGLAVDDPRFARELEQRGIAHGLVSHLDDLIGRVHEEGCLVNGPEAGLVDFPAILGSEIVFLCWKHGEPRIGHWHRIADGFAGRRPLLDRGGARRSSRSVH